MRHLGVILLELQVNQEWNRQSCFFNLLTHPRSSGDPVWPGNRCHRSTGRFPACWRTGRSCTGCHSIDTRWHLKGWDNNDCWWKGVYYFKLIGKTTRKNVFIEIKQTGLCSCNSWHLPFTATRGLLRQRVSLHTSLNHHHSVCFHFLTLDYIFLCVYNLSATNYAAEIF